MKYINLIDKLSSTDKETIKAYITKYGCNEQFFIGIDKWLDLRMLFLYQNSIKMKHRSFSNHLVNNILVHFGLSC